MQHSVHIESNILKTVILSVLAVVFDILTRVFKSKVMWHVDSYIFIT